MRYVDGFVLPVPKKKSGPIAARVEKAKRAASRR
jgi:uncharacterized protein YbaA (DUF1428 family)